MLTTLRRFLIWGLTGVAIVFLLASCGESTVAQCNRLADVVNQTKDIIDNFEAEMQTFNADQAGGPDRTLEDIRDAANDYTDSVDRTVADLNGVAATLDGIEVSDESLAEFKAEYAEIIAGIATAFEQASAAMGTITTVESEADLPAQVETLQAETSAAVEQYNELSIQESTLIAQVNLYCGATGGESNGDTAPQNGQ